MNKRMYISVLWGLFITILFSGTALAQDANDLMRNMTESVEVMPALAAALAYLGGLLMAIWGVFKTIEHVNNPSQVPLRTPINRFLIGGALFALPIVIEAAAITINDGDFSSFNPQTEILTQLSSLYGVFTSILALGNNVNSLLENIIDKTDLFPSLVAAIAYILGIITVISALYKTRDYIDDPTRAPLKDAVIRYVIAGALFALPRIFEAMYETLVDSGLGLGGVLSSALSMGYFFYSSEADSFNCDPLSGWLGSGTLGEVICQTMNNTSVLPFTLASISYMIGIVFGVWGLMKVRDHVTNPNQTPLHEAITRLFAGGAFFALPAITVILQDTITPWTVTGLTVANMFSGGNNTGFNESLSCGTSNSLDQAFGCFMQDVLGPTHVVLNFFCYVAGTIFIMIGISRLIRSAQEGPKGPGGIGTITTFVIGGLLMSATEILKTVSVSLFGDFTTKTMASLTYTSGMGSTAQTATLNIISAVLKFMILIGMISFVRGIFIMRDVAEGNQQASTMAGITHIVGGALAVNLGPLLNAVQTTLGITAFGVSFG